MNHHFSQVGGVALLLGVAILMLGTFFHPMEADPNDAVAAFAEYAADDSWIASHLGQLLGVALMSVGLVALSWRLFQGNAGVWALLGGLGAVSGMLMTGALQAVDGIALKVMVDRLAAAAPDARAAVFEAAFAVRQIEIGLASISVFFFGLTAIAYAVAIVMSPGIPSWLGGPALLSGVALLVGGILYSYTGFSEVGMMVTMPANLLLAAWALAMGIFMLRSRSTYAGRVAGG